MKKSFIVGKACNDYNDLLDRLNVTPVKTLKLHDDAFTNWKVNTPTYKPHKVYNNDILERIDE